MRSPLEDDIPACSALCLSSADVCNFYPSTEQVVEYRNSRGRLDFVSGILDTDNRHIRKNSNR